MEKAILRIVVPWDFTPVAEKRIKYALAACKERESYKIDLIHVISPGGLFSKGALQKKRLKRNLDWKQKKSYKNMG